LHTADVVRRGAPVFSLADGAQFPGGPGRIA
jgi:hypothetical protein